jgi:hypothetical protein
MAHDESERQGADQAESEDSGPDSAGPITITTTDPAIVNAVDHPSDWKIHPDSTICVETTQAYEPNPLYVAGANTVVYHDQRSPEQGHSGPAAGSQRGGKGKGRDNGKDQNVRDNNRSNPGQNKGKSEKQQGPSNDNGDGDDQKDSGDDQGRSPHDGHSRTAEPARDRQQPSMAKSLMVTAGIALVAGALSAFAYSAMMGSKSDSSSSNQSQSKGNSSSQGGSSSKGEGPTSKKSSNTEKGSGGQEDKESGQESSTDNSPSSSQNSTTGSKTNLATAEDVDMLKTQIMDLTERVATLNARADRMSRLKDEMPTLIQSLQIEMGDLAHKLADLAPLPAKVRDHENRLATLTQELHRLRSLIDSVTSCDGHRLATSLVAAGSEGARAGASGPALTESPEINLGIHLLEQGQYPSARTLFERLQRLQPGDARVWYFGALAVGLASGDWNDQARELAEKGLERERAGTPPTAQIDRALDTPTPLKGEPWLNALRQRSLSANRTP